MTLNTNSNFKKNKKILKHKCINCIDSQVSYEIYTELLNKIFKHLKENNIVNMKLLLDYQFWTEIHEHSIIKKNATMLHNLTKLLKSKKLITKNSKLFPKNQVLNCAINPLAKSFLHVNLSKVDRILDARDKLINELNSFESLTLEKEVLIYIYLRLFIVKSIPLSYYKYINYENIFHLNEQMLLVFKLDYKIVTDVDGDKFIPIKNILFSKNESKILKIIFKKDIDNLFDYNNYIFTKEFEYYEKELKKYCNEIGYSIKEIRKSIEFEYQYENTPLDLTLYTFTNYPKLSLLEIDKLFPNTIDKSLLDLERNNLSFYRKSPAYIDDYEPELDKKLSNDYEIYEKLKEIKKVPTTKYATKEYLNKWYNFIDRYTNHNLYSNMLNYLEGLLDSANQHKINKPIESKTLQSYIQRMFDYCFNILIKSNDLDDAILKIHDKLNNSNLAPEVKSKYENAVYYFLTDKYNLKKEKVNNLVNYNRSIIFEDELENIVSRIDYIDKKYKCNILRQRRKVFVILGYFSGLRKTELLTRLVTDFYYVGNQKFVLDVNLKGIKKSKLNISLKNKNAVRRVEFQITNKKLFKIVKEYYDQINMNNLTFIFPNILSSTNNVAKKKLINESQIKKLNSILQKVTNRYTVIHSLRHTYATNEVKKIISLKNKSITDVFDLTIRMGHSDFLITLNRYVHIDLIYLKFLYEIN